MGFTHEFKIDDEKVGKAKEILKKILEHPNLYALGYMGNDDALHGVFNVDSLNLAEDTFCKTRRLPYDLILRAMAHINAHLPKEEKFAESWEVGDEYGEDLLDENISNLGGYFWDKSEEVKNEFKSVLRELEAHIVHNEAKQYTHFKKLEKSLLDTSMSIMETDDPTITLKEIATKQIKQAEPSNVSELKRIEDFTGVQAQQARPNFENSDGRASTVYDYMESKYNSLLGSVRNGDMSVLTSYFKTLGHFYGISSNNSFLLHSQASERGIEIENMKPFGAWAKMQNDNGKKVSVLKGSKGFDFIKATSVPIYEKDKDGSYILDGEGKKIIATNEDGEEQFFYRYIVEKRFDINQTNAKAVMGLEDAINEPKAIIQRLKEIIPNSSFERKERLMAMLNSIDLESGNAKNDLVRFFGELGIEVDPEKATEIEAVFALRLGVENYPETLYRQSLYRENLDIPTLKARFKALTASVRYIAKEVGFESLLRDPIEYKPRVEDDARMAPVEAKEEALLVNDVYINDERDVNHPSYKLLPFSYDDMFMANDELRSVIRSNHKDQAMIRIKNTILSVLIRQNNFFEIVAGNENLKKHYIELSDSDSEAMIALSEAIYNDIQKEQNNESTRNQESFNGQSNDNVGRSSDRNETGVSQGTSTEQEVRGVSRITGETSVDSNESINGIGDERDGSVGEREGRVHPDTLKSRGGLLLGQSDGVKTFIGLNIDGHELFEDANGVRSELYPSENGLPSHYKVEAVSMQSVRASRSRLEQYNSFRLDHLTVEEFKAFNQEYGYYTEDGSSYSPWYKIEREMAKEPLDSIFLKARLGIHELKETFGDDWTKELNAMWQSGVYEGLSKDKAPYIQRLKDIPLDTLLYDSNVPTEQVLEVFYPLMSDAEKNAHQDTIDPKINNRVYDIVEALGLSKEQWLSIAKFKKSEFDTNVIGMSVLGMEDDFRPIDEYIELIRSSKEYQAFRNSGNIEIEMAQFVDKVNQIRKNLSWMDENGLMPLDNKLQREWDEITRHLIVSLYDPDGISYKEFDYTNFDELKKGFKDAINEELQGIRRLEALEALGFLPSEAERLKTVKEFVGNAQYSIISRSDEFKEIVAEIYETITTMPKTYETDGMGDNAMVVMHYFKNGSDWYITERDMEDKQLQAFGYVVLNGDVDYAELGYINIEKLKRLNVEMDFHWEPRTLRQLKQELRSEESDENETTHDVKELKIVDFDYETGLDFYDLYEAMPFITEDNNVITDGRIIRYTAILNNDRKINVFYDEVTGDYAFSPNYSHSESELCEDIGSELQKADGDYESIINRFTAVDVDTKVNSVNESLISKTEINKLLAGNQFEYFNVFSAGKKYGNKTTVEITDNTFILHVGEDADVKLPKNAESNIKKIAELLNKIKGDIIFEDSRSNLSELDKIDVEARNNAPKSKLEQIIEANPKISIVRPTPNTPKERVFDYSINEKENVLTVNNLRAFYNVDEIKEKFIDKQVIYQIFAQKYHFDLGNPVHVDILKNELNISVPERTQEAFTDTTVLNNAQSVRDYAQHLEAQYPRFLTTSAMSLTNTSLYSNYMMMDAEDNIKYLHVTHDGHQEWETLDVNTAKERLERAYFSRIIQEWGLDAIQEAQSDPLRSNPEIQKIFNKYKMGRIKENEKYLEEVAEHYGSDSAQYASRKERYLKEEEGYETHFYTTLEDIVKTFDEENMERIYSRLYHGVGFDSYKRALEKIRDIDFGKTQKSSLEALDKYFGGKVSAYISERKAESEKSMLVDQQKAYLRELENEKLKTQYGVVSRKEFYEKIVADGYTKVESEKRGATNRYYITNPETYRSYDINKKDVAFIESLVNRDEVKTSLHSIDSYDAQKGTYTVFVKSNEQDDVVIEKVVNIVELIELLGKDEPRELVKHLSDEKQKEILDGLGMIGYKQADSILLETIDELMPNDKYLITLRDESSDNRETRVVSKSELLVFIDKNNVRHYTENLMADDESKLIHSLFYTNYLKKYRDSTFGIFYDRDIDKYFIIARNENNIQYIHDSVNISELYQAGEQLPQDTDELHRNILDRYVALKIENIQINEDLTTTFKSIADAHVEDDNFVIQAEVVEGGQKTRFKNNLLAIDVVRKLEAEQTLTKDDKVALSKYVGWGGIPQAFYRTDGSVTKGWDKEAEELKSALTPLEYENARRSTLDSHYTPETVIKAIWASVDKMGFKGGTILEPSVGVGKFFGYMPSHLKPNARILGVELDPLTSKIAQTLYPKAKITNMGFQDYKIDNGSVDLVIGNPPFGAQKIGSDDKRDFSIHNYFFAKSVDTLKEGGILAMVVSNAFLDGKDEGARAYIANQANLVGAIRLPNNAFNEAGTEVTTDIIFIQKRRTGQENNFKEWNSIGEYNDTPINSYFVNHPENLLGEWGKFGTMYRGDEPALVAREDDNLVELLNTAIKRLPKDIATSSKVDVNVVDENATDEKIAHVRVGAFYHSLGKIYKRLPDVNGDKKREEVTFDNEKAQERVLGMIAIAEVGDKLRMMQVNASVGEDEIESTRLELNRTYDLFVKEYGYINNPTNKRLFLEDPRSSFILSLERKYDKGVSRSVAHTTGQKPREPYAEKADIFLKRTQYPYQAPTQAPDVKSAMMISLSEYAYLNLNYIASLVNKTRNEVIDELVTQDLIFEDPNEGWVTREEYLSGNVKQKYKETNDPRNLSALKTVIPADIPAVDIAVKAGASWLPEKVIKDFATYITGDKRPSAYFTKYNATWNVRTNATSDANFNYGTQRVSAERVLDAVLNNKQITVYDKQADDTQVINHEATMAVANKIELVRDRWNDWIWKDERRREELGAMYNEKFNVYAKRQYDGSHLVLHGKVSDDLINLRPHQKNAVWRALQTKNGLLDHTVGTGKTFTGIATIMEMKRTGRASKPLIAVPNHLTEQWGIDWMNLYPSANILVATKKDFEAQNRKVLMARMATGDYDAIIIGHSQLIKIENDPEFVMALMREQINEIQLAIDMIRREDGKDARSVKDAERSRDNMEKKLEKLEEYKRDDNLTFKELGVDFLFVDEMHEFKNLEYFTRLRGVAGLGNPSGSKKAYDLMLKVREMHDRTDGKNLIGATGTPISNTIAEMYTLQRYLQNDELKQQELTHFDAWVKQYAEVTNEWELAPSGKYKLSTRLSKFVNVPELMQQYRQFADVVTREDINKMLAERGEKLPVPRLKGGKPINVVIDRSPEQAWYIGEPDEEGKYRKGSLVYRSENLPKDLSEDNMLKIMSEARKVALDMRIMNPSAPDREASKVNESVKNMLRLYKQWEADKGAQIIFCDLSTPNKSKASEKARIDELIKLADEGDEKAEEELSKISPDYIDALESSFSVYDDIKAKLIKNGIPESEIAFIHDANTDLQKTELFAKVNSGKVRFILGSTAKMGAGTNVQERLVALHNLDAPWRPSDLEQREGRIIRQGNALYNRDPDNFEIEVFRYATKNTLDSRLWQILETKAKFIEQIKTAEMTDREVEDIGSSEAMNSAEMKALSSGNPLILEEMDLTQKIKKLEAIKKDYERTLYDTSARIKYYKTELDKEADRCKAFEHDIALTKALPEKFAIELLGTVFDKREEAGEELLKIAKEIPASSRKVIGKYGEFTLSIARGDAFGVTKETAYLEIKGARNYEISFDVREQKAGGLTLKLGNTIARIPNDYEGLLMENKWMREQIPVLEARLQSFEREQELDALKERHRAVMELLQSKSDNKQSQRDPNEPIESKIIVEWKDTFTDLDTNTLLRKSIRNYDPSILNQLGNYRFVGKCLVLEDELNRETYMEFRKVFEAFGGVWDKKVQAVVFSEDGLKRMQGLLSSTPVKTVQKQSMTDLEAVLDKLSTKHKGEVKSVSKFIRDAIEDGFNELKSNESNEYYLVNNETERKYPIRHQEAVTYAKLIIDSQKYINKVAQLKSECTENYSNEVQNNDNFSSEKEFRKSKGGRNKA